jgi:arylsulfatase A-like enzyme
MPLYNEVANIPCFIWHPQWCRRIAAVAGTDHRSPATLLDYFGLDQPADMQGRSSLPTLLDDTPVRDYALFGYHGCHINITDGRYVYMRSPVEQGIDGLSTR